MSWPARCMYCGRRVWPWQRQGWRYLAADMYDERDVVVAVWRWHGSCHRLNVTGPSVVGYANPDGSGRGNWAYPRPDADDEERQGWS